MSDDRPPWEDFAADGPWRDFQQSAPIVNFTLGQRAELANKTRAGASDAPLRVDPELHTLPAQLREAEPPKGGPWEDFQTAAAQRSVGPGEAFVRSGLASAEQGVVPYAELSDALAGPIFRETPAQRYRREHGMGGLEPSLTGVLQRKIDEQNLQPDERYSGTGAEIAAGAGSLAGALPLVAAETALGGPALAFIQGAESGRAERKRELMRQGLSESDAEHAAEVSGAVAGAMQSMPLGKAGGLATRALSGGAAMGAAGAAGQALENAALPDERPDLKQEVFTPRTLTQDVLTGAILHGALGHRAKGKTEEPKPKSSAATAVPDLDREDLPPAGGGPPVGGTPPTTKEIFDVAGHGEPPSTPPPAGAATGPRAPAAPERAEAKPELSPARQELQTRVASLQARKQTAPASVHPHLDSRIETLQKQDRTLAETEAKAAADQAKADEAARVAAETATKHRQTAQDLRATAEALHPDDKAELLKQAAAHEAAADKLAVPEAPNGHRPAARGGAQGSVEAAAKPGKVDKAEPKIVKADGKVVKVEAPVQSDERLEGTQRVPDDHGASGSYGASGSKTIPVDKPHEESSAPVVPATLGGGAPGPVTDAVNKDGLPIETGAHVGLTAAMGKDGLTTVHDKAAPDTVVATHASGERRPFNLLESRDYHERIEDAEMQAGKDYYEAHRVATEAEHSRMRQLGFDPNEIEALHQPHIDAAAHEARARGNTTPDVGNEPYRVAGEGGMRADGDVQDHRFILDREGNKYTAPIHGKLLRTIETVTAQRDDGRFAVMDPNSGMVLAEGDTRLGAERGAKKMAGDLGRQRLQKRLEKQPALSQQQLREQFKEQHPEAKIQPPEGETDATDQKGRQDQAQHAEGVRPEEGQAGVLRQPEQGQDQGRGQEAGGVKPEPKKGILPMAHPELAANAGKLRKMADGAGWAEKGTRDVDAAGNDVETPWVPKQPWFKAVQGSDSKAKLKGNTEGEATREAVRKAQAGAPMTRDERRHVKAMLDWKPGANSQGEAQETGQEAVKPKKPGRSKNIKPPETADAFGERKRKEFLAGIKHHGGLPMAEMSDITGERGRAGNRLMPGLFRKEGENLDHHREWMAEAGYFPEDSGDVAGDTQQIRDLIRRALNGEPVLTQADMSRHGEMSERDHEEALAYAKQLGVPPEDAPHGNLAAHAIEVLGEPEYDRLTRVHQEESPEQFDEILKEAMRAKRAQEEDYGTGEGAAEGPSAAAGRAREAEPATPGDEEDVTPGSLQTQTGRPVGRFAELEGAHTSPKQAYDDAANLTGLHLKIPVAHGPADMDPQVPMHYDLAQRRIVVNPNPEKPLTRASAAFYMAEELLHAVDHVGGQRTLSGGSPRLASNGDIAREAMSRLKAGGEYGEDLQYPLADTGMSDGRMRAELFARLGTLYFAEPEKMKRLLPLAHGAFDEQFRLASIPGATEYIRGKVWTGAQRPAETGVGLPPGEAVGGGTDESAPRQPADQGLGRAAPESGGRFRLSDLRHALARSFETTPGGTSVRLDDLQSAPAGHVLADPFYSALMRATSEMKGAPKKADAAAWKGWLDGAQRRGEFKQEERDWMGLDQWLAQQKAPVTREALQDFVRQNQVQVTDVKKEYGKTASEEDVKKVWNWINSTYGEPDDNANFNIDDIRRAARGDRHAVSDLEGAAVPDELLEPFRSAAQGEGGPKFGQYQLPGGTNYQEHLLTLPGQTMPDGYRVVEKADGFHVMNAIGSDLGAWKTREAAEASQAQHPDSPAFKSTHFDEPNILAHVRTNDRTGPNGEKILHVEEVQSDWHQQARKQGYANAETAKAAHDSRIAELKARVSAFKQQADDALERGNKPAADEAARNYGNAETQLRMAQREGPKVSGVPDAPFKSSWPLLAMKRMIRKAAEEGYDQITWTTGEQQAARYDLSTQVHQVGAKKNADGTYALNAYKTKDGNGVLLGQAIPENKLAENVGKDLADKIIKQPDGWKVYEGLDLKVGGEGMRTFYDRMLPNEVNKYVKKWGGKVGETSILGEPRPTRYTYEGPDWNVEQLRSLQNEVARGGRDIMVNPLTGEKLDFALNRVANEHPIAKMVAAMIGSRGTTLKEAVETLGDDLGPSAVKDLLGGQLKAEPQLAETKVHSLDITPAMRDMGLEGQALFHRTPTAAANLQSTGGRAALANQLAHGIDINDREQVREVGRGSIEHAFAVLQKVKRKTEQALKSWRSDFDRMLGTSAGQQDLRDAVEQWERGQPVANAKLAPFFDAMKRAFDQRMAAIKAGGFEMGELQNYFPHLYKDLKKAQSWMQDYMSRRPLEGGKGWSKERFYETLEAARAAGLEPISENPADLVQAHLGQLDKYLALHQVATDLDARGMLIPSGKWHAYDASGDRVPALAFESKADAEAWRQGKPGHTTRFDEFAPQRIPLGWAKVNDPAFANKLVPDLIAKDLGSILGPTLTDAPAFRALRKVQNGLVSAALGLSGYHATMTTGDTVAAHLGDALLRLSIGDVPGAAKSFMGAIASPVLSPIKGKALIQQSMGKTPTGLFTGLLGMNAPADAHTAALLRMLEQGGGQIGMSPTELNDSLVKFSRLVKQAQYKLVPALLKSAAKRAASGQLRDAAAHLAEAAQMPWEAAHALMENITPLIHKHLVPAQKKTAKMLALKFELDALASRLGKQRGDYAGIEDALNLDAQRQIAGRVVKQVDDRLGQKNYRSLYMNRYSRDVMQASLMSPGWLIGSMRTIGGGVADVRRLATGGETIHGPLDKAGTITDAQLNRLSGRTAYLIGLHALVMGLAVGVTYALTGQLPGKDIRNYYTIRTGRKNDDGSDERLSFPSYLRDEAEILHGAQDSPLRAAKNVVQMGMNKLNPTWRLLYELGSNKDYYGNHVYDPDADLSTQARQVGEHVAKTAEPFAVAGALKSREAGAGAGTLAANVLGLNPAPGYMVRTPFQDYLYEHKDDKGKPVLGPDEAAHKQLFYKALNDLRAGREPDLSQLTPKEQKRLGSYAETSSPEASFKGLKLPQKIQAWEHASDAERAQYHLQQHLFAGNVADKLGELPPDQQADAESALKRIADWRSAKEAVAAGP